jgi:hypothetical protein
VTLTPVQAEICPFEAYEDAYLQRFPSAAAAIQDWARSLRARLGRELGAQHYIMRVQPRGADPTTWSIVDNLASAYGAGFSYPVSMQRDMALGRVTENFIPPEHHV